MSGPLLVTAEVDQDPTRKDAAAEPGDVGQDRHLPHVLGHPAVRTPRAPPGGPHSLWGQGSRSHPPGTWPNQRAKPRAPGARLRPTPPPGGSRVLWGHQPARLASWGGGHRGVRRLRDGRAVRRPPLRTAASFPSARRAGHREVVSRGPCDQSLLRLQLPPPFLVCCQLPQTSRAVSRPNAVHGAPGQWRPD
jgi:hypothetical protein